MRHQWVVANIVAKTGAIPEVCHRCLAHRSFTDSIRSSKWLQGVVELAVAVAVPLLEERCQEEDTVVAVLHAIAWLLERLCDHGQHWQPVGGVDTILHQVTGIDSNSTL